jgi:hypothetical protein
MEEIQFIIGGTAFKIHDIRRLIAGSASRGLVPSVEWLTADIKIRIGSKEWAPDDLVGQVLKIDVLLRDLRECRADAQRLGRAISEAGLCVEELGFRFGGHL